MSKLILRALQKLNEAKYPLEHESNWHDRAAGGKMTHMSPEKYLSSVRPLTIDDESRETIDHLKDHIKKGGKLDPVHIYADGKEDGRHRAHAAKELGIKKIPVLRFEKKNA